MSKLTEIKEELNEVKQQVKKLELFFLPHKRPFVKWTEKGKGSIVRRGRRIYYSYILKVKEL